MPFTLSTSLGKIATKYWLVVAKIAIAAVGLIFNMTCDFVDISPNSKLVTDSALAEFLGYYADNTAKNYTVYSIMIVVSFIELYINDSHKNETEPKLLGHKKYGASFYLLFYTSIAFILFDSCVDQSIVQLITLCLALLIAISRILG
jgi:hypothetical protein